MSRAHQLTTVEDARRFALGGNAKFTIVSLRSGTRFTYRVRDYKGREGIVKHVSLLAGPDQWVTLGVVLENVRYKHATVKSRVGQGAASVTAFTWLLKVFDERSGDLPKGLEFWHEGKCARCGRSLTVPESIKTGFGPQCAELSHAKAA